MTRCPWPNGNHGPGLLRALKIATHGKPIVAARCIGPLSWPTNSVASSISAALSRGVNLPQRFKLGPGQTRCKRFRSRAIGLGADQRQAVASPQRRPGAP